MSKKAFSSELERALARPDVDQLTRYLVTYHDGYRGNVDSVEYDTAFDLFTHADSDPDLGLALVMLSAATYDEPDFLAFVSAGLLENLLQRSRRPSEEFFQRVLDEARKTERFRWMLSGVYRAGMISDQAAAIKRCVGAMTCDDPLPPRPWA